MNEYCKPESCEDFAMLLSCCLDGETSEAEQEQLETHLAICDPCRSLRTHFKAVNNFIDELGEPAAVRFVANRPALIGKQMLHPGKPGHSLNWRRLTYAALAVSAMIVLFAFNASDFFTPRANSRELLAPIVALTEINSERIRDQEFLRETLELELRTLRLELAAVDLENSNELMLGRLELLLDRLNRFESTNLN